MTLVDELITELVLPAADLAVGDVVQTEAGWVRVVGEPVTLHRGWSPFDHFELLIGADVQANDDPRPRREAWGPVQLISVRRRVATQAAGPHGGATA